MSDHVSASDAEELSGQSSEVGEGERGEEWEATELDYEEEVMEVPQQPRRVSEEDEVRVHAVGDGELSSGEEGEIKEERDPTHHTVHSSPQHSSQATLTGDREGDDRKSVPQQSEEEEEEESELSDSGKVKTGSPPRQWNRVTSVCRHFLQGKCSWGKDCRFSHDDRALQNDLHSQPQGRFRPLTPPLHGPPPQMSGPTHEFMIHEGPYGCPPGPEFIRVPPPGLPSSGMYVPYEEQSGSNVSHVAEENEGWYRLRTVANHWSSDEDRGCDAVTTETREQRGEEDQVSRQKKKPHRTKRESSSLSESEVEIVKKKKKRHKGQSATESSPQEKKRSSVESKKKKRRCSSSSEPLENETRGSHGHVYPFPPPPHPHMPHPPGPPENRFLPHGPPPFPPYGPPRYIPDHGPLPYGPPPLPPHGHHYGPPPYPSEWRDGGPRSPPRHHFPHSTSDRHWRRRDYSSDSASDSEYHHRHHRKKASRKEKTEDDKTLNRKQQLLEELNAINKVIERKKQKKVAKDDF